MDLLGIGSIVKGVAGLADSFITTDKEQQEIDLRREELAQRDRAGQVGINMKEAESTNMFIAGWRPALGWVCTISVAMIYIPKAVVLTALWTYQALRIVGSWSGVGDVPALPPYPDLGLMDLLGLLSSILGISTMRTIEKVKGAESNR
jgi:hypothetical protein